MHQLEDQPIVEEDDVLYPPPTLPIFPPLAFVLDNQTHLTYSSITDLKHLFTIDDVPTSKSHASFFDMYSWCTVELQTPNSTIAQVIVKFIARLIGRIRERWIALGEF